MSPSPRDPVWHPPLIEKCNHDCTGAPRFYVYGGAYRAATHWHMLCWMCGALVVGAAPGAYSCNACDYKQGVWNAPPFMPDYDPEFAAERSSPG